MKQQIALIALTFLLHFTVYGQNRARFSDIQPGMVNKHLEHQALRLANERATNLRWPLEYKKALIISPKWNLLYDKNGFVKGREIHMQLYCTARSGKCGTADFTFKQRHIADGFYSDRLQYVYAGDFYDTECE